ncbi:baeyer-Villiger monooxygenase-like [Bradysia coprophila]|uniref:baeyer-Villiger monooxygenase-like n=1 Tax=Bradysia coprophila TaxID=38358 RepID=UPI00187D8911|nr:baeyer-Villiger monooxygenase-like [Bradysia coprophila]
MVEQLDVLIVGAGFAGLHLLNKLRKLNFKVKVYEAGSEIGGVWYWNCYPGARVDSDFPFYQFSEGDIYKDFEWTERFPGREELTRYFKHVDRKLNLSKDIKFDAQVTSAEFNGQTNQWLVKVNDSDQPVANATFLLLCTGALDRNYTPPFKGVDKFRGMTLHTRQWPRDGVDVAGKRVAVIGTGSSGVQVIQEIASQVGHLTVYQRTPNLALPMQQSSLLDQTKWKFPTVEAIPETFKRVRNTFSGMDFDNIPKNAVDVTAKEREMVFEALYKNGGFSFWIGTFKDVLYNQEANDAAYQFWYKKTRARINDPVKQEILAPTVPPHPFGTKRPSLEQRYYEVFNQHNVDIINIRKSPIIEITEKGIKTQNEGVVDVDIIVFATGFDALTGGILNIPMINDRQQSLQDKWKNRILTNVGIAVAGFPNMFFTYGPQAPTAFANGPVCVEVQGDWIIDLLVRMRKEGKTKVEATEKAELEWKQRVNDVWSNSLFPLANSWYQGVNIPGKPQEALSFAGGMVAYNSILNECAKNNYDGFVLS